MIILCVILIIALFILIAFIFHLIKELGKENLMQYELIEKLGDYIVEKKRYVIVVI